MTNPDLMNEDWAILLSLMPKGWEELAHKTMALKGLRKDKEAGVCLRILLMHLACGYSLRETVTRAKMANLADLSDVALLKRLRKSKNWLQGLCYKLLQEDALTPRREDGLSLRLVDGTIIQEPGPTGSTWRIHYSLRWPELMCDHFALTTTQGAGTGESFTHIPVAPGDHLVADRGYSNFSNLRHVVTHGAVATIRINPKAVRILDASQKPFQLKKALLSIKRTNQIGCWPVGLTGAAGQSPIEGRLCVIRKSQAAIAKAKAKVTRTASSNGRKIQADTLLYAEYVMVFSTAPESFASSEILDIYRLRWQIEMVFKRFKQLANLGHLPKEDEESSQAWLYGKLFVALLSERLVRHAETLSPWGYDVSAPTQSKPVEGI